MADKDKERKPLIKVEEIEEGSKDEKIKETETSADDVVETPETKSATPAVSSFSQLDSAPPAPPDSKVSTKDDTSEETVSKDEQSEEKPSETSEETSKAVEEESENLSKKEQISSDEVKEWLKDVRPDTTKDVEKGRGPGGKLIVFIVLILLVLGTVVGGVLYFQKGVSEPAQQEADTTQAPADTETPVDLEEEELDLTTITVSVLNGSGIAGEAGKVKDLLSEAGFSEDNIQTGNADSYDYQDISVSLKSGLPEKLIESIETSLSSNYEVKISGDDLQENSTYDVVIIVGK
jgi:hypothetical protein